MATCIKCGGYAGEESWRKWCRGCYREMKREEERRKEQDERVAEIIAQKELNGRYLSDERVRKLLQLCHPDKHNNSPNATEITKWLLSIRKLP